jgi:hypothetical protein
MIAPAHRSARREVLVFENESGLLPINLCKECGVSFSAHVDPPVIMAL